MRRHIIPWPVRRQLALPRDVDVPRDGDPGVVTFVFNGVTDFQALSLGKAFPQAFLLLALTGASSQAAGFLAQLTHTHREQQRLIANRHGQASLLLGSAGNPTRIDPLLFMSGDSVSVEIKSLTSTGLTARIEVTLIGVALPNFQE